MSEEIKTPAVEQTAPAAENAAVQPEATVQQAPVTEETKVFKTFATEEEFTNAVKSERSKAKNEILTELGVKSVDDAKAALAAKQELEAVKLNVAQLQEQLVLTQNSVADAYKNEALTLARANLKEGVTLEAALKEVLVKFPNMVKPTSVAKGIENVGIDSTVAPKTEATIGKNITTKYPWIKL
jgi:hypothetical protein